MNDNDGAVLASTFSSDCRDAPSRDVSCARGLLQPFRQFRFLTRIPLRISRHVDQFRFTFYSRRKSNCRTRRVQIKQSITGEKKYGCACA